MNARISYAQHGEDVVLARALHGVRDIVYCDVGAAHPVVDSISRSLHALGWRGVHVEPVPTYAALLRAQRAGDVVVESGAGAAEGELDFWFVPGSGLSTTSAAEAERAAQRGLAVHRSSIRIRRLADILDEHLAGRTLHALKVDVEGAERDVLLGAELARFRPWVVVVDAAGPGSGETELWEALVVHAGYTFAMFDGLNRWYCSNEHLELVPALSYPACPLDGWIRAGIDYPPPVGGDAAEAQAVAALEVVSAFAQMRAAKAVAEREAGRSAKLQEQVGDLKAQVAASRAEARTASARLDAMRSSQWWRVTAPGRKVTGLLRRRRRF